MKCQLIVEEKKYNEAVKVFKNTKIEMKKGARLLVSVLKSEAECKTQLEEHNKMMKKLSKIAKTQPQNVCSCYTKGVQKNDRFS